jgi:hypothetical protein
VQLPKLRLDSVFGVTPERLDEFGELYRREIGLPF